MADDIEWLLIHCLVDPSPSRDCAPAWICG
jgi:hypothetical protein